MILLTRKAEFSSAHYYWNDAWSQEENERVFGKCANRNGHGHNYTLEVTVAGEVDPVSGFVVDLKAAQGHPRARSRQRLRPSPSQPRSPRVRHHASPPPKTSPSPSGIASTARSPTRSCTASVSTRCPTSSPTTTVSHERRAQSGHLPALTSRAAIISARRTVCTPTPSPPTRTAPSTANAITPTATATTTPSRSPSAGPVDPITGMVCDLGDLDAFAQTNLLARFDHHESEHARRLPQPSFRPQKTLR